MQNAEPLNAMNKRNNESSLRVKTYNLFVGTITDMTNTQFLPFSVKFQLIVGSIKILMYFWLTVIAYVVCNGTFNLICLSEQILYM